MKVSVCMITYNHGLYIKQAIESVLMQQCNFEFELVIGEDCSRDSTASICEQYQQQYPGKVRVITEEYNVGMLQNFLRSWKACSGDYIAFLDGDDYWTDPLKLQKQVDFLETNPEFSACFHNVVIKSERKGQQTEWVMHKQLPKDSFDTEDVLGPWFIASPGFVFRNYPDFELPSWFFNCKYGDLPFMLLLSLRGSFKYIDDVMAVYRLHDTGMTTKDIGYDKAILMVYIYESFNIYTQYSFQKEIKEAEVYEIDRHIVDRKVKEAIGNLNAAPGILQRVNKKITNMIANIK